MKSQAKRMETIPPYLFARLEEKVAEAKAKSMSDEPFPDGESAEDGDAESGSREAEKSPAEGVATGGGLPEGASPYVSESEGVDGREGAETDRTRDDGDGNVKD